MNHSNAECSKPSEEQIFEMLAYLNTYPKLARNTSEQNINDHDENTKEAWNVLSVMLNMLGTQQTPKQWMLTWIDLCKSARSIFQRIAIGEERIHEPQFLIRYAWNILLDIQNPCIEDAKEEFKKRPVISSLLSLSSSPPWKSSTPFAKRPLVQVASNGSPKKMVTKK